MKYIRGEIYASTSANWVCRYYSHENYSSRVCDDFIRKINYHRHTLKEATCEQRRWLEACEKANKYIPFSKVSKEQIYEIY